MLTKNYLRNLGICIFISLFVMQLSGCGGAHHKHRYQLSQDGPPSVDIDVSKIQDAIPKVEPLSKYGNPSSYNTLGKKYYVMKSSFGYSEKGIASWYGMKFHAHRTSSGEPYDLAAMTAAHKTLPIPVSYTHLDVYKRQLLF